MKEKKIINYWELDYKSKFKRTLLILPLVVIVCFLSPLIFDGPLLIIGFPVFAAIVWGAQAIYTYAMWKKSENNSSLH